MKISRRAVVLMAAVPFAAAATFLPGLASHGSESALPAGQVKLTNISVGSSSAINPKIHRDPTANPAVRAALEGAAGGAAGVFGAAAVDFIVKMTKKLVTLAEDEAETASSDSSSSGAKPNQLAFDRLFPSGDNQFNVSGAR